MDKKTTPCLLSMSTRYGGHFSIRSSNEYITRDCGSPFRIDKPRPLGEFDREPVRIPSSHPLARKLLPSSKILSSPFRLPEMGELMENLNKMKELAKETLGTSSCLLDQSWNSLNLLARSTEGELNLIKELLMEVEARMDSEMRMYDEFWKRAISKFDKLQSTSYVKIIGFEDKIKGFMSRQKSHKKSSKNFNRTWKAAMTTEETILSTDKLIFQIQNQPKSMENLLEFSTALAEVEKVLISLHQLAPVSFRVNSKKPSIGGLMEETIRQLSSFDRTISKHFPPTRPGETPTVSFSSSASTWNPAKTSTKTKSTYSVKSLLSEKI